jgi:putative oligomerization/nucleic acid binding protein
MGIADELEKLQHLKDAGALTESEFEAAKRQLLAESATPTPAARLSPPTPPVFADRSSSDDSLGRAVNKYTNFQIASFVIGLIIFVIFACTIFSNFNSSDNGFPDTGYTCDSQMPGDC